MWTTLVLSGSAAVVGWILFHVYSHILPPEPSEEGMTDLDRSRHTNDKILLYSELSATLAGKNVVVTGASRGIGERLAYAAARARCQSAADGALCPSARRSWLECGCSLVCRTPNPTSQVAKQCRILGAPVVHVFPADMATTSDVLQLFEVYQVHPDIKLSSGPLSRKSPPNSDVSIR